MPHCDRNEMRRAYEAHADDLLSLAMHLLQDPHVAEDVVHDVFLRFFQTPPRLRQRNKMRSYLAQCVANRARDVYRKRQKLSTESYTDRHDRPSLQDGPIRLVEERDVLRIAYQALRELPYEQREAVILKLHHSMTFRQIIVSNNLF